MHESRAHRVVGVAAPPAEGDLVLLHVELVDVRVEVLVVWVACRDTTSSRT